MGGTFGFEHLNSQPLRTDLKKSAWAGVWVWKGMSFFSVWRYTSLKRKGTMCFPGWTGELKPISGFLSAALSASQHGTRQAPFGKCQKSTSTKLSPTVFHDRFFGWINMVKLDFWGSNPWKNPMHTVVRFHLYCTNWWATSGISKDIHVFILISYVDIFIYTYTGHIAMKPVSPNGLVHWSWGSPISKTDTRRWLRGKSMVVSSRKPM